MGFCFRSMKLKQAINKSGYYRIKVIPNQNIVEFKNVMTDGTIKIALSAPPEKGKANKQLISFFANELAIKRSQINIVSGLNSRLKIIDIDL